MDKNDTIAAPVWLWMSRWWEGSARLPPPPEGKFVIDPDLWAGIQATVKLTFKHTQYLPPTHIHTHTHLKEMKNLRLRFLFFFMTYVFKCCEVEIQHSLEEK